MTAAWAWHVAAWSHARSAGIESSALGHLVRMRTLMAQLRRVVREARQ